jgi:hypothetical protein
MNELCNGKCFRENKRMTGEIVTNEGWITFNKIKDCPCVLEECSNFIFCKTKYPKYLLNRFNGLCFNCGSEDGDSNVGKLEFKQFFKLTECNNCHTNFYYFVKFPTCPHFLCIGCLRNMCINDYGRFAVDPVKYGGPPCYHQYESCISRPCSEYDSHILEKWENEKPEAFDTWAELQYNSLVKNTKYERGVCNLCF